MDEALLAGDVTEVSDGLKKIAGGAAVVRRQGPRLAARRGRTQQPSWAGGCRWLSKRMQEVTKLLVAIEATMGQLPLLGQHEVEQWDSRCNSLSEHLWSLTK